MSTIVRRLDLPTRDRIYVLLCEKERSFDALARICEVSYPTVYAHVKLLISDGRARCVNETNRRDVKKRFVGIPQEALGIIVRPQFRLLEQCWRGDGRRPALEAKG
jgi:DNA-binding transcriptional ArsR family regulator